MHRKYIINSQVSDNLLISIIKFWEEYFSADKSQKLSTVYFFACINSKIID